MGSTFTLHADPVTEAYLEEPLVVGPERTVRDVLHLLKERRRSSVLISEREVLLGVFTERDALKRMARGASLDERMADAMTRGAVTVSREETVGDAIRTMAEGGYRRLPVVDGTGTPTGVVSVRGLLRYLVEHFPNLVYTLPPTPHYRAQSREGA